jgi:hypothetical protein
MRSGYSVAKVTTFCGLALVQAFATYPDGTALRSAVPPVLAALRVLAWICVVLCVVRGVPVIAGSLRHHWDEFRPFQPAGRLTARPHR